MTMTARYRVQAIPLEGLSYYNRCGRSWPRGEGFVEIEVVPDEVAPPAVRGAPDADTVIEISESDFAIIQADQQMRILTAGTGRPAPARSPLHNTPVAPARKLPPQTHAPVSTPVAHAEPVSVAKGKPGPKPKAPTE